MVLVDATKASGWKIEFHTWYTVPIRNAKYCFCEIICFIFLKLRMTVVQSCLYSKTYVPLCPMGYPVNVRLLLIYFLISNFNLRACCVKYWSNIGLDCYKIFTPSKVYFYWGKFGRRKYLLKFYFQRCKMLLELSLVIWDEKNAYGNRDKMIDGWLVVSSYLDWIC